MYLFAVMGKPIAHSLSPEIHHAFAKHLQISVYYKKILSTERAFMKMVTNFINNGGHGLNITLPFKEHAFILCGENVSDRAKAARAVNTITIRDNMLFGDNTDGAGLVGALNQLGWQVAGAKIAILGAGGAARGVIMPLAKAGASEITVANRTLGKAEALVDDLSIYVGQTALKSHSLAALSGDFDLIINATSAGLEDSSLGLRDDLNTTHAYDMIYKPRAEVTPFMRHFGAKDAMISDGFGMLVGQAAESFAIWTGTMPDIAEIDFSFLRY